MGKKRAASKSPRNRQVTEEALLKDPFAQEAFEKLTQKRGVDREKLLSLLLKIPYVSNKVQPLVDGMENRTVRKLPDRMRSWAESIEKVNASPWLTPDHLPKRASVVRYPEKWRKPLNLTLTPEWAQLAAQQLNSLPRILRFYADHLRAWLEVFHPGKKRRRELGLGIGIRPQTFLILDLLKLVRDSAQGPCYKEIAYLLEVAFGIAGKVRPLAIRVENLSKLEKNNPWPTFIMHEFPPSD